MNRLGVLILLLAGQLGQGGLRAEEEEFPPEPIGANISEQTGVHIHEAILPGVVLDWSVVKHPSGPSSLALLLEVDPEDDQADKKRQHWEWNLELEGELEQRGPTLPEDAAAVVSFDARDVGDSQPLVAVKGSLLGLNEEGEWSQVLTTSYDIFPVRSTRGRRSAFVGELVLRSMGRLRAFQADSLSGELGPSWEIELPVRVDREWNGLRLDTLPVHELDDGVSVSTRFVAGPDLQGKQRIRSRLISPTDDGELEDLEAWNMFSTPEEILESWYVTYNGSPALIVTTVLADKHGVFEKKKLRLFSLTADRTRAGSGPLLEVMTRSRNWYSTCAGIADLNGDGLDDLVSAQPKGLGAGSLWVEGHLGLAGGGFSPKSRGSEVEVEEGELCSLAYDVSGDGTVDLVVRENDSVLVFQLLQEAESKVVVADSPRWRVDFDDLDGRPWPVEIFAKEPTQVLVMGKTKGRRRAVRILRFR